MEGLVITVSTVSLFAMTVGAVALRYSSKKIKQQKDSEGWR